MARKKPNKESDAMEVGKWADEAVTGEWQSGQWYMPAPRPKTPVSERWAKS